MILVYVIPNECTLVFIVIVTCFMLPLLNILLNGLFIQVWLQLMFMKRNVLGWCLFFFQNVFRKRYEWIQTYKQGMLIYQMVIWRLGIISISFQTSEGWGSSHTHLEHMGARGHLTITWSIWRQGGVISHSLEYLNVISHSFGVSEGWGSSYTHLEYMNTGDYLDCIVRYELF